jgi:adenosine deaminase
MTSLRHAALAAALALGCASTASLTQSPSARTARHLASLQGQTARQADFLRDMPKGGDLHTHLSGSVYAESYLRWAVEDGLCVRRSARGPAAAALRRRGGDPARGGGLRGRHALRNALHRRLLDAEFRPSGSRSGHDHFFATFSAFDALPSRAGDMLAEAVTRLADQNTWYLESMQSLGVGGARRLGHTAGWSDDLAALRARLPEAELDALVTAARARLDAEELRMRALLRCDAPDPAPGCRVTVRYVVQVIRTLPREEVFAQIAAAVQLIEADPRVVALNLVAPEDDPVALRDYADHMRAVAHLTERGTRVPGHVARGRAHAHARAP